MSHKFCVITAALYNDIFLEQAIVSVKNQLVSKNFSIQHLIVFDNENVVLPDSIKSKSYEINYFKIKGFKNGPSIARNFALDIADGDYICFLDADDIWNANYFDLLTEQYNDPNVFFVAGNGIKYIDDRSTDSLAQPFIGNQKIDNELLWNVIGCPSGYSYRNNNVTSHIRFDENLYLFEDWHFYLQIRNAIGDNFYGYHLGAPTYFYRISTFQSTANNAVLNERFLASKNNFLKYSNSYSFFDRLVLRVQAKRLYKKIFNKKTILYDLAIYILQPQYFFSQVRRLIK